MDDGADGLAFVHQGEGFVDVFEVARVRDKGRELDVALHGVFHHARQLAAALDAAEGRAQPAPAGDELEGTGGYLLPRAGHADDDTLAPAAMCAFECGAHDVDIAYAFEGMGHAPARHLPP